MLRHNWLQKFNRFTAAILILGTDLERVTASLNKILHDAFCITDVSDVLPRSAVLLPRVDDVACDFAAAVVRWGFPSQRDGFSCEGSDIKVKRWSRFV